MVQSPPSVDLKNFREVYCEEYDCAPNDFEEHLLRRSLTPVALIARPFIQVFKDDFFSPEIATLRAAGSARKLSDVYYDVDFYFGKFVEDSAARSIFGLRLRGSVIRRKAQRMLKRAAR